MAQKLPLNTTLCNGDFRLTSEILHIKRWKSERLAGNQRFRGYLSLDLLCLQRLDTVSIYVYLRLVASVFSSR